MKPNIRPSDYGGSAIKCTACPASVSARGGGKKGQERLGKAARAEGWTFPRVLRHGSGTTRRAEPLCPACSKKST